MKHNRITISAALALALLLASAVLVSFNSAAAPNSQSAQPSGKVSATYRGVSGPVRADVSPPLRSMKVLVPPTDAANGPVREIPERGNVNFVDGPHQTDPAVQSSIGSGLIPTITHSFDGPSNTSGVNPPDPNGEVGPNHFFAQSNLSFQIFDKNGTSVFGPALNNTVWAGFGGACQTENSGDGVVLYDQLADRWLFTQFTSAGPTYYNCVALSTTGDPTGPWQRYAFTTGANFPDYPKYGMMPEAYYISTREFDASNNFAGIGAYALNRAQMLAGNLNPQVISFIAPPGAAPYNVGDGLLPADLDGFTLPPAGTDEYYVGSMDNGGPYGAPQDALPIWRYHVDFATPVNSTFTLGTTLNTDPFDSIFPCSGRACIPQPGTSFKIDILSYRQRPLFRLAYRNFGNYASLVTNQSVEATPNMAGIRWYELRATGNNNPTIYQQGTYAPGTNDTIHRWMASIAMDNSGNMGLGYSASAAAGVYPSVRYTGRLSTDPLGQMPQGEGSIKEGTGSETGGGSRWGDYTDMTVDPTDDCTFWYVNEYLPTTSASGWRLRIGSFKFPECTPLGGPTPTPGGATATPVPATATATTVAPSPTATQCPSSGMAMGPHITGLGKPAPQRTSNNNTKQQGSKSVAAKPAVKQPNTQLVQDPSFEAGTPSPYWTEESTNFGTPLCDASCGTGGGTAGPNTGNWWVWFGGTVSAEDGAIQQAVTIPNGGATLSFYLWIGNHSGNGTSDYMRVLMDNTEIFRATDADTQYDAGYVQVSVDVSSYANGGSHTLRVEEHNGASAAGININVDDVTINTSGGGGCPTVTPGGATATAVPPTVTATPAPCGTGGWGNGAAVPLGNARSFGAYVPTNNKFYVLGGRALDAAGNELLNPLEYNPATNTWMTKGATFNDSFVNNMAGGVLTDSVGVRVYLVGGSVSGGTTATNQVRIFDPVADSISVLSSDPWPANDGTRNVIGMGAAVYNDKLYLIGGYNLNVDAYTDIWELDPMAAAGSKWTHKTAVLPTGLSYIPAATLGNYIYTGGGATYDGTTLADDAASYRYDPVADSISAIAPIPQATSNTRAVAYMGQVWVLGGGFAGPFADVYAYDPATTSWMTGPAMPDVRRNFAADTDGTHIFVAAGYDDGNNSQTTTMFIYDPGVPCPTTATPTNSVPTSTATMLPTDTQVPTITPTDCPNPFVDINGNVFYTAIHFLYCRGVVNGTDATHYGPAGTATRAQFAKVVVLGFAIPAFTPTGGTSDFTDVPNSYYAYAYIETGYHALILSGYDSATCAAIGATFPCYGPNRPITRAQLTKLVVAAGGFSFFTPTSGQTFTDVGPSNVFFTYIETAVHYGIINGYPDNTFRPNNNIRRDEMAQIVYKGVTTPPMR